MASILGHVAVSASFDPTARTDGKLAYLTEAERLRAADDEGRFQGFAFALNPAAPEVYAELCPALREAGYTHLRGIVAGFELTRAKLADEARAFLSGCLELVRAHELDGVFCVAQEWPAGRRDADFERDLLPAFVDNVAAVLPDFPEVAEFGIEPLIPVEQQHVNTLGKARRMADACNEALGARRVFPVPDLAHLYGLVPRHDWGPITRELVEAIEAGEVRYAHLSIPESRTDQIVSAIQAGDLPEDAVRALTRVAHVDTEAFDPADPFLDVLRERVPRFAAADRSGWTEGKRFERLVESATYFRGLV